MTEASSNLKVFGGRRVLVTGHTGFKGAWLTRWLLELGAEVTGLALDPPTEPALFDQLGITGPIRDQRGDIRDADLVRRVVRDTQPEVVFHMAAQPLVRASYAQPLETFASNVMGTAHVLDAIRHEAESGGRAGPMAVVAITTDKCYRPSPVPHRHAENEPLGGHDPYSASKAGSELVIESYRRSYFDPDLDAAHGVRLASARAGNVIGGGDWATDRIVPDLARALGRGEAVHLRSPHAIRPWQHVLDALGGYLELAAALLSETGPGFACGWNFGPADDDPAGMVKVRALAEAFVEAWREAGSAVPSPAIVTPEDAAEHLHEAPHLGLSVELAQRRLGWSPVWDTGRAVRETAAWYAAVHAGEAAEAERCTLQQIQAFNNDRSASPKPQVPGPAETSA